MDLKLAIEIVLIIIGIIAVMLLGDYIGHKFGRMKLAIYGGYIVLALIVIFAIYAAIMLLAFNK
jgi:hypothetical protein